MRRKYISVESRQKTFHLLHLLRTTQTAGWLLTQQQKRHNISALLHFNTLASHAASVSTRPPPPHTPTPLLCSTPSQIKGKRKDFAGAPSRLAAEPAGATCCALASGSLVQLMCERIASSEGWKGASVLPQEFSTGVSLLKIHCKSVETQSKEGEVTGGSRRG